MFSGIRLLKNRKKDSNTNEYLRIIRYSEAVHDLIPDFPKDFSDSALIAIFGNLRLIKRYLFVIMWCLILLLLFV